MSSVNRDEPADLMDYDAYGSPELFIMEDIDCPAPKLGNTGSVSDLELDTLLADSESWYPSLWDLMGKAERPAMSRQSSSSSAEDSSHSNDDSLGSDQGATITSRIPEIEMLPSDGMDKNYRASLNSKYRELQACLRQSTVLASTLSKDEQRDLATFAAHEGKNLTIPRQAKSLVLQEAITSIKMLQGKCRKLTLQIRLLQSSIQSLQVQMNGLVE